jgi:hypothetical protein
VPDESLLVRRKIGPERGYDWRQYAADASARLVFSHGLLQLLAAWLSQTRNCDGAVSDNFNTSCSIKDRMSLRLKFRCALEIARLLNVKRNANSS